MTNDDEWVEQQLGELRSTLMRDSEVPLGMVARLQAAVNRESRAHQSVGWQVRLTMACLFYLTLGLWSLDTMTIPLAILLGVVATAYPWSARSQRE